MKLGVILPHTLLYGGVKRFVELGTIFINRGHEFFIFTPDGIPPTWTIFKGQTLSFDKLPEIKLDALFFTEPRFLHVVLQASSKEKIFYFVRGNENLNKMKIYPEISFFANSSNIYNLAIKKIGIEAFRAFGGIDTKLYKAKTNLTRIPENPFTIIAYGRIAEKWKGTMIIVRALERIYKKNKNLKLILFDTPLNSKMRNKIEKFNTVVPHQFILNHPVSKNYELFNMADIFVAAEKEGKAGWSNTTAEAMASGLPVIATTAGSKDFLFHNETGIVIRRNRFSIAKAINKLIESDELRYRLAIAGRNKIQEFDWEILAIKIELFLSNKVGSGESIEE